MYTLIVFTSTGCRACPKAKLVGEQAASELGAVFGTQNITKNITAATEAGIQSVPTTVLFNGKTIVGSVQGVIQKDKLVSLFRAAMSA